MVEAVKYIGFMIDVAFRRVDIFRYILISFECSSTKTNYTTREVVDGEHYPATEAVVHLALVVFNHKPGAFQVSLFVPSCFRSIDQRIPGVWRITQLKFLDHIFSETTLLEITQTNGATLRSIP